LPWDMVALPVPIMAPPSWPACAMPCSPRRGAGAAVSVDLEPPLHRGLAPLVSARRTGRRVSKVKAESGKSSLILATWGSPGVRLVRLSNGGASYSDLCRFSSCGLFGYLAYNYAHLGWRLWRLGMSFPKAAPSAHPCGAS